MSYCRWSTNDFQCDLYVYASVGDFYSVNVAGNRVVYNEPLPPPVKFWERETGTEEWDRDFKAWCDRHQLVMDRLNDESKITRVPIGLPYDGQSFGPRTPQEAVEVLEMLRDTGYRFPDEVIEDIRSEIEDD